MKKKILNKHSKAWIYNKIQGHYKQEACFQGLDISFYFSIFKFCLFESNNFQELENNLEKYNMNDCLNFIRKKEQNGNKLYFSYPGLSFQAETLFYCWDEILKIQEQSREDISKAIKYQRDLKFMKNEDKEDENQNNSLLDKHRFCYGNKPNLSVKLEPDFSNSIQKEEERKVFPISIDFKYEYNSFRRSIISKCENIIKEGKDIIFIQTDIEKFFHNLQIDSLARFIKERFPFAKNLHNYLIKLKQKLEYDTLPIGWVLSRFVANIISQEFHNKFKSAKFQNSLKEKQRIDLKYQISYVDDFIFLLTIPDEDKDISEQEITNTLLREANLLLDEVLKGDKPLKFHEADSEKTKCYRFNKNNISVLKTNFAFFNTADDYLIGDSEIVARVDEVLLPVDNEITLSENQHFYRNLKGLQKIVIGNHHFREQEVNDLLAQIRIKVEKTGSRYIKSVFRLFYFLELSDISKKLKKQIREKEIKNIFKKFEENHNFCFEWVKFFNGYFNFLKSIEYQDKKQFFELLDQVLKLMEDKDYDSHDKMLFQLLRNEYIFKIIFYFSQPGEKNLRNKLSDNSQNFESNSMLLKLSDQRYISIKLSEEIFNQNTNIQNAAFKILKPIDLTWISVVLGQILKRNYNIDAVQLLSISDQFQNENGILNFSIPRIATAYLPFNTKKNQSSFIEKLKTYNLKDSHFQDVADQLIKKQKDIETYYRFNEKKRLDKILETLNSEKDRDMIWNFIKKSFSSEKDRICAYFIANRLNSGSEFIKYILTSLLSMESSQLTSWSTLPLTIQKTGIHTNLIIKELLEMKYNEKNEFSKIIDKVKKSIDKISPNKAEKLISPEYFGVNIVNLDLLSDKFKDTEIKNKPFKITIAPLSLNFNESFDYKKGFKFKSKAKKLIDRQIRGAIDEAVMQESSILVFPELSIPRDYLVSYLKLASEHHVILIGGLEYFTDLNKNAYNSTIVSIPVKRSLNPGGRGYFAFEQIKNFPASKESYYLSKSNFKYKKSSGIFVFKSNFWEDFAVLTCSDFLSLGLRWILQGEIQTVFVPAQNTDSTTYEHISETSIRELHCITIVCNNPEKGSSHCYAPYYDRSKRTIFKKTGISKPEWHTFNIQDLKKIKKTQREADPKVPFRNPDSENDKNKYPYLEYKQLPPDWRYWKGN